MLQSKLKKMYDMHSDSMRLPPLDEIRTTVSRFYEKQDGNIRKPTFIILGDLISFQFIKKMLYSSDFKWPSVFGIGGILVFSFHLIKDGVRDFTIGSFHSDMIFMLLMSICLFLSSYPFLVKSFDCNMQEQLPASPYFLRLIKLSFTFIVMSLLSVSVFYFLGFTKIIFY